MSKMELRLEIDADLVRRARDAGLDLAALTEVELRRRLDASPGFAESSPLPAFDTPDDRSKRWAAENAEAIREHNQRVAERGLIGSEWRRW